MSAVRRALAIDIGSNMVRVVRGTIINKGVTSDIQKLVAVTRIAAGLMESQTLRLEPIERTGREIVRMLAELWTPDATVAAVATGAFRGARNREEARSILEARIGAEIEIVSGEREAELAMRGVRSLARDRSECALIDIGGSSTEVILERPNTPRFARSIELGVVTLTEAVLRSGGGEAALEREVLRRVDALGVTPAWPRVTFCAGGAAGILAAYEQGEPYLTFVGRGRPFDRDALPALFARFWSHDRGKLATRLGIDLDHLALVPAGYLILRTILARLDVTQFVPTGRGVAEGRLDEIAATLLS